MNWLKRKWLILRINQWAELISNYHHLSKKVDTFDDYEDNHIKIRWDYSTTRIWVKINNIHELVFSSIHYLQTKTHCFREGRWIAYLKYGLLPAAKKGRERLWNEEYREKLVLKHPIDDSKVFGTWKFGKEK